MVVVHHPEMEITIRTPKPPPQTIFFADSLSSFPDSLSSNSFAPSMIQSKQHTKAFAGGATASNNRFPSSVVQIVVDKKKLQLQQQRKHSSNDDSNNILKPHQEAVISSNSFRKQIKKNDFEGSKSSNSLATNAATYGNSNELNSDWLQLQHSASIDIDTLTLTTPREAATEKRIASPSSPGKPLRTAVSHMSLRCTEKQQSYSKQTMMLSDQELQQVELMYKSNATKVCVCSCLANLYFSSAVGRAAERQWKLVFTGIPAVILNLGNSRCRSTRKLELVLAERGTGFLLWKDTLDSLSKLAEVERTFHTLLLSDNHNRMAGLSYDSAYSAMSFFNCISEFMSDPENIALFPNAAPQNSNNSSNGSSKNRKRHSIGATARRVLLLKKNQISSPCCFQHVTSLKPYDFVDHLDASGSSSSGDQSRPDSAFGSGSGSTSFSGSGFGPPRAHSCAIISALQCRI